VELPPGLTQIIVVVRRYGGQVLVSLQKFEEPHILVCIF